jgi:hypothetical protein
MAEHESDLTPQELFSNVCSGAGIEVAASAKSPWVSNHGVVERRFICTEFTYNITVSYSSKYFSRS